MKSIRVFGGGLAALAVLALAIGCGRQEGPTAKDNNKPGPAAKESGEHSHGEGPHGGAVGDWGGGKYHVEFTVDHDKQEATVYILGSDEKSPAPVKARDGQILLSIKEPSFQVPLKAAPQEGDPEGAASRFTGKHEKLGTVQEFAGSITGEVDGTPYTGEFKEEPPAKE